MLFIVVNFIFQYNHNTKNNCYLGFLFAMFPIKYFWLSWILQILFHESFKKLSLWFFSKTMTQLRYILTGTFLEDEVGLNTSTNAGPHTYAERINVVLTWIFHKKLKSCSSFRTHHLSRLFFHIRKKLGYIFMFR